MLCYVIYVMLCYIVLCCVAGGVLSSYVLYNSVALLCCALLCCAVVFNCRVAYIFAVFRCLCCFDCEVIRHQTIDLFLLEQVMQLMLISLV